MSDDDEELAAPKAPVMPPVRMDWAPPIQAMEVSARGIPSLGIAVRMAHLDRKVSVFAQATLDAGLLADAPRTAREPGRLFDPEDFVPDAARQAELRALGADMKILLRTNSLRKLYPCPVLEGAQFTGWNNSFFHSRPGNFRSQASLDVPSYAEWRLELGVSPAHRWVFREELRPAIR